MSTPDANLARQADYYDHHITDRDFEINRPHGESRFYRYLMDFKFTRVVRLLGRPLHGRKVLVVCCGSGMDAEYLVRSGAAVVAMDISAGCLERARVRADRYSLKYELVRGDAETLPFRDGAFDYGFVHDGLHHLSKPDRALAELARVAGRGVLVSEPTGANLTNLLIRLNLVKRYEEAGNFVMRLEPKRLESLFRSLGFDRVASSRYLVKYGHPPGPWWRLFDREPLFGVARAVFGVLGVALFGRWGNKLAFIAERLTPGSASYPMRIVLVGPNYSPEVVGIGPYTTDLAEHLVAVGHKVTVLTSFPYYPHWRIEPLYNGKGLFMAETI